MPQVMKMNNGQSCSFGQQFKISEDITGMVGGAVAGSEDCIVSG